MEALGLDSCKWMHSLSSQQRVRFIQYMVLKAGNFKASNHVWWGPTHWQGSSAMPSVSQDLTQWDWDWSSLRALLMGPPSQPCGLFFKIFTYTFFVWKGECERARYLPSFVLLHKCQQQLGLGQAYIRKQSCNLGLMWLVSRDSGTPAITYRPSCTTCKDMHWPFNILLWGL